MSAEPYKFDNVRCETSGKQIYYKTFLVPNAALCIYTSRSVDVASKRRANTREPILLY